MKRVLPVADRLAAKGHAVTLAMRPGPRQRALIAPRAHRIVPAPVWEGEAGDAPAECYADLLLRTGYAEPGVLPRMLRGWIELYDQIRPAMVIADFAPTALLAAKAAGVTTGSIGCGFTMPPLVSPMPPLRPWAAVPAERIIESEARALAIVNAALDGLEAPPLARLADSVAVDAPFLCNFPELEHYGGRAGEAFYGNQFDTSHGAAPAWPEAAGPRVFAYLRGGSAGFAPVLRALAGLGLPTLLHPREASAAMLEGVRHPLLRISERPVHMGQALAQSALVVCHSPGTLAAGLMAGLPVLLLPEHVEQAMVAHRVMAQGLGLALSPGVTEAACAAAITRLMTEPAHAARARAFAAHYHGYDPDDAADAIGESCHEILQSG